MHYVNALPIFVKSLRKLDRPSRRDSSTSNIQYLYLWMYMLEITALHLM